MYPPYFPTFCHSAIPTSSYIFNVLLLLVCIIFLQQGMLEPQMENLNLPWLKLKFAT